VEDEEIAGSAGRRLNRAKKAKLACFGPCAFAQTGDERSDARRTLRVTRAGHVFGVPRIVDDLKN